MAYEINRHVHLQKRMRKSVCCVFLQPVNRGEMPSSRESGSFGTWIHFSKLKRQNDTREYPMNIQWIICWIRYKKGLSMMFEAKADRNGLSFTSLIACNYKKNKTIRSFKLRDEQTKHGSVLLTHFLLSFLPEKSLQWAYCHLTWAAAASTIIWYFNKLSQVANWPRTAQLEIVLGSLRDFS